MDYTKSVAILPQAPPTGSCNLICYSHQNPPEIDTDKPGGAPKYQAGQALKQGRALLKRGKSDQALERFQTALKIFK